MRALSSRAKFARLHVALLIRAACNTVPFGLQRGATMPRYAPLLRTGILPRIASLYLRNSEEEKTKSVNQEVEKTQPAAEDRVSELK